MLARFPAALVSTAASSGSRQVDGIKPRGPMNRKFLLRFLKASTFLCALAFIFRLHRAVTSCAVEIIAGSHRPGCLYRRGPRISSIRRHLTVADLPAPAPEQSVDNGPHLSPGRTITGPSRPRALRWSFMLLILTTPLLRTAPNGDLFLAESSSGKIKVFRGVGRDGTAKQVSLFATGLHQPFGIIFYPSGANPKWIYIGNTDGIVRFPYNNGDLKASDQRSIWQICPAADGCAAAAIGPAIWSSRGTGPSSSPRWDRTPMSTIPTRIPRSFTAPMYLSSLPREVRQGLCQRSAQLRGRGHQSHNGELWCSTNERDALGNNLVPDYVNPR